MLMLVDHVVEIGGSRCLVLRDEVGLTKTSADALIVQRDALADGAHLWLSSGVMEDAVSKNGMLPVYGLWQIMSASGLIDNDYDVHVVETSEDGDGHYLLKMGRLWQVGVLFQGELQGLPDEALKKLDEGEFKVKILEFDLTDLVKPASRVLSAAEHAALNIKRKKQFNLRLAAVFSFTLAVVYGVDSYLDFQYKRDVLEYKAQRDLLSSYRSNIEILKRSRAMHLPNQTTEAKTLWYAIAQFPSGAIKADRIVLSDRSSRFVVSPAYAELAFDLPSETYDVRVNNAGEAIVSWTPAQERY